MKNMDDDYLFLENATETLRAVAHPLRLLIIQMLHEQGPQTVTAIHLALGIEQAVASHHLRIMKDKQVLTVRREGKNAFYNLARPEYAQIYQLLEQTLAPA